MGFIFESAFGRRFPLPPKVSSPSWQLTDPLNLDLYATNPKDEHGADIESTESSHGWDSAARQPDTTDLEDSNFECAALRSGESASLQEPSAGPSSVSPTSLPISPKNPGVIAVGTAVKWSDVVARGSEALQPANTSSDSVRSQVPEPKTVETTEVSESFSTLRAIIEVTDILDALMLNCPDFSTLFSLAVSCKAASKAFEDHPQGIINVMLNRMPEEFQHMTSALIAFKESHSRNPRSIRKLMQTWLIVEPMPKVAQFLNPLATLRDLARVFSAIDLFTDVIANNCVENFKDYQVVIASRDGLNYHEVTQWSNKHPLLYQTEWSDVPDDTEWTVPDLPSPRDELQEITHPLNDRETYRIKRALLRYELFCSLFHLGPDKYFDTRHHPHRHHHVPDSSRRRTFYHEQVVFFQRYMNPWEVGEMAVIAQFAFDVVRHAFFHKYGSMRYHEAYKSWFTPYYNRHHGKNRHDDHEEVVDEFHNHLLWYTSQGLGMIRGIYDDREQDYGALTGKYGHPRYRIADFFIPFEKVSLPHSRYADTPSTPRRPSQKWSDTPGMELPSKGWLAKNPADEEAYWGEKWMRKIGFFIWDRG